MRRKKGWKLKVRESDIQKQILDYLRYNRVFCWKYNNAGIKKPNGSYIPTGLRGVSDILGILPNSGGQFLAIEVKNEKGYPSQYQLEFLDNVKKNGGVGFIAKSVEDVEELLKDYFK